MSNALFRLPVLVLALAATSTVRGEDPKVDVGDPLPHGPKLRLGTTRYRNTWATTREMLYTPAILSPDAKTLILQRRNNEIVSMDATTGKLSRSIQLDTFGGSQIKGVLDGRSLATAGWPGSIAVVDLETGKRREEVQVGRLDTLAEWAISADGSRVAVVNNRSFAREHPTEIPVTIWSLNNEKSVSEVKAMQNDFVRASLSADGKVLATWGRYKPPGNSRTTKDVQEFTVQVWDADTGAERCRVVLGWIGVYGTDPDGFVVAAAVSPDGKQLATAAVQVGGIELFDTSTGKLVQRFASRAAPVKRLVYSPDGARLAALGFDGAVQLWDLKAGTRLGVVESPVGDVAGVVFPEAGRVVAWAMDGRAIALWEVPSGKRLHVPEGHTDAITSIVFSADGKTLSSAGADHIIAEWDVASGKMLSSSRLKLPERVRPARRKAGQTPGGDTPDVTVLSPDGNRVAVAANGNTLNELLVLDRTSGTELLGLKTVFVPDHGYYPPVFTADGARVFYAPSAFGNWRSRNHIPVWEIGSARPLGEILLPRWESFPFQPAFSPDGTRIVTFALDRNNEGTKNSFLLTSWNTTTGAKQAEQVMTPSVLPSGMVAIASDNRTAIVAVSDFGSTPPRHQLFTWDITTGKVIKELAVPDSFMRSGPLVIAPEGKTFVISGRRGDLTVILFCATATGEVRSELIGSSGPVTALAFSPDGKTLASGSQDTTVLLWDLSAIGK